MDSKQRRQAERRKALAMGDEAFMAWKMEELKRKAKEEIAQLHLLETRKLDERSMSITTREMKHQEAIKMMERDVANRKAEFQEAGELLQRRNAEVTRQAQELDLRVEEFNKSAALVESGGLLKEILLELELDADPHEIALNLRKKFGLLIPAW